MSAWINNNSCGHFLYNKTKVARRMESEIILQGMEFFAYHGFYPEEQNIGCKYTVDLTISLNTTATQTDQLTDTLNYEEVYSAVNDEMKKNSKLIEHVAQRIVERLKRDFPIINHITILLTKHNPPLGGEVKKVSIRLKI